MACAIGLSRILREDRATKDGFFVHEAAGADLAWLQCPEKVLSEAVCGAETTLGVEETPYDL